MKVRALTQVFLENVFYKEGQVFEYYGTYNRHLEPVVTRLISGKVSVVDEVTT